MITLWLVGYLASEAMLILKEKIVLPRWVVKVIKCSRTLQHIQAGGFKFLILVLFINVRNIDVLPAAPVAE